MRGAGLFVFAITLVVNIEKSMEATSLRSDTTAGLLIVDVGRGANYGAHKTRLSVQADVCLHVETILEIFSSGDPRAAASQD